MGREAVGIVAMQSDIQFERLDFHGVFPRFNVKNEALHSGIFVVAIVAKRRAKGQVRRVASGCLQRAGLSLVRDPIGSSIVVVVVVVTGTCCGCGCVNWEHARNRRISRRLPAPYTNQQQQQRPGPQQRQGRRHGPLHGCRCCRWREMREESTLRLGKAQTDSVCVCDGKNATTSLLSFCSTTLGAAHYALSLNRISSFL
mmetsp:Transcript_16828/g.36695  ORF Transcript_16828/g.36695 Transcript_16828/m.36695 type:complete len:200 (-) Transcript_16828:33-632(-)